MENRIAILSDVHGNSIALDAVFADIDAQGINAIYHLGDIVGYGDSGADCLRAMQARGVLSIQGNHERNIRPPRDPDMRAEAQCALEHELEQLTEENVETLLALPKEHFIEDVCILVHGALTGCDHYIITNTAVRMNNEMMQSDYPGFHICFFGHTHLPMVIRGKMMDMDFRQPRMVRLAPKQPYLINPGSVGQPRDRCPMASYGIYDHVKQTFTYRRVPYDIPAQQERMRRANLPDKLWMRLAVGV